MGSAVGAAKTAAARAGVSVLEYEARRALGQKWCHACRRWHALRAFGRDRSRFDGRSAKCLGSQVTTVDRPGQHERRLAVKRGLSWCCDCNAWLPIADVTQGRCREHHNAVARAHYALNPGAIKSRVHARRRGLDPIPDWWRAERFDEFGGLCAYGCGRSAFGLDHIWPVARGGESRPANLVPACRSCNSRKSARDPREWVNRGFMAFPSEWAQIAELAVERGTDRWLFDAEESEFPAVAS